MKQPLIFIASVILSIFANTYAQDESTIKGLNAIELNGILVFNNNIPTIPSDSKEPIKINGQVIFQYKDSTYVAIPADSTVRPKTSLRLPSTYFTGSFLKYRKIKIADIVSSEVRDASIAERISSELAKLQTTKLYTSKKLDERVSLYSTMEIKGGKIMCVLVGQTWIPILGQ